MSKKRMTNGQKRRTPQAKPAKLSNGRFALGNAGGPGRPKLSVSMKEWRVSFTAAITPQDVAAVVRKLVLAARKGQSWAIREMLERVLGPAQPHDLIEELEELRALVAAKVDGPQMGEML